MTPSTLPAARPHTRKVNTDAVSIRKLLCLYEDVHHALTRNIELAIVVARQAQERTADKEHRGKALFLYQQLVTLRNGDPTAQVSLSLS